MIRNVLISGAGVAGLALAYWLERAGVETTIVERTPAFRRGGQAVDIRGVALEVVEAMGLLEQARELRTQLKGMSMLDSEGNEASRTTERTYSAGRLDSPDIEIFRDDLCELLMTSLGKNVEFIYGDSITAIGSAGPTAHVSFEHASQRAFDLIVGADGVYSKTRRLVFDNESSVVKPLDVVLALFTTPNLLNLDAWQLGHREDGVGVIIYPNLDKSELRIGVGFGTNGANIPRGDLAAQKEQVAAQGKHLGGPFPALFQVMRDTPEFYYNELAQVRMPQWSQGPVVLAGDAAHCASPFSGQGTSLALVGAFVLGRELALHPDQREIALQRYEERMRPFVALNQDMVDLTHKGPIPDEIMTRAKNGIDLADLLATT
ncbi:FAD-dependent monooxygenase [Luteibacter aegosomatissinici]|uniref:FAD-dependent monooxygenase n=1 Tax=Luteibacter aegosomatissinici TaxID=2911539 RepID=UPI001FF7E6B4|nr:FAD-dependent monooxygenase [Luteibacter aegosomatissinici]UPG96059.1 FAD-dependent monooxygenase [Luteibacter aegosomatissinici]